MYSKLLIREKRPSVTLLTLLFFIAGLAFSQQIIGSIEAKMSSQTPESTILVDPLLKFSSNLMKAVDRNQKNVIFSPMSIHMALNLVLVGAEPKSQTEKELLKALGYEGLASDSMDKIHEAYAELDKKFKSIHEEAKKQREYKKSLPEEEQFYEERPDNPVIDMWNLAITKDAVLQPAYVSYLQKYYNGAIEPIDAKNSSASEKILTKVNSWAKEAGYANGILSQSELAEQFRMLLLSAVRIEAFWIIQFHEMKFDELFYNDGHKEKLVQDADGLSTSDLKGAHYIEFTELAKAKSKEHHGRVTKKLGSNKANFDQLAKLNFRSVKIPLYGNLSYTILEPLEQGTGNELNKLTDSLLIDGSLGRALEITDDRVTEIEIDYLAMPKFKFESDIELISPLKKLGLLKIFDSEQAELSKISASEKLYVDKAKHEAVIEVNKIGLKAAGVTKIRATPLMAIWKTEKISVEVKNPYLFVIRYDKLPLFMGQLSHLDQ